MGGTSGSEAQGNRSTLSPLLNFPVVWLGTRSGDPARKNVDFDKMDSLSNGGRNGTCGGYKPSPCISDRATLFVIVSYVYIEAVVVRGPKVELSGYRIDHPVVGLELTHWTTNRARR